MDITVKARHMDVTEAIRGFVESKVSKLPKYYDNILSVDVTLDTEADHSVVEIVVTARKKTTFVATDRNPDMYACVDGCLHKIVEQIRRHKDKVRDRQGIPHEQTVEATEEGT